jgi:hypothetical protein
MGCGSRWHDGYVAVRTSRTLICCSNAAARRDVDERTSWRDLGEIIGKSNGARRETADYLELVMVGMSG